MESAFSQKLKTGPVSCLDKVTYKHRGRFEMFERHLGLAKCTTIAMTSKTFLTGMS